MPQSKDTIPDIGSISNHTKAIIFGRSKDYLPPESHKQYLALFNSKDASGKLTFEPKGTWQRFGDNKIDIILNNSDAREHSIQITRDEKQIVVIQRLRTEVSNSVWESHYDHNGVIQRQYELKLDKSGSLTVRTLFSDGRPTSTTTHNQTTEGQDTIFTTATLEFDNNGYIANGAVQTSSGKLIVNSLRESETEQIQVSRNADGTYIERTQKQEIDSKNHVSTTNSEAVYDSKAITISRTSVTRNPDGSSLETVLEPKKQNTDGTFTQTFSSKIIDPDGKTQQIITHTHMDSDWNILSIKEIDIKSDGTQTERITHPKEEPLLRNKNPELPDAAALNRPVRPVLNLQANKFQIPPATEAQRTLKQAYGD
jgi:hypothetical protein